MPASLNLKRFSTYLCAFILIIALFVGGFSQSPEEQAKADVEYLTSPELMGRGYSNKGHTRAAEYIQDRFKDIGLENFGDDYFQKFKMKVNYFKSEARLTINGKSLVLGKDFLPYALSGSGKAFKQTNIIHVGNGLMIPQKNINDYRGTNVTNAILLLEGKIPGSLKRAKSLTEKDYSYASRADVATVLGAQAMIILVDKLTYRAPTASKNIPILEVLTSAFPPDVESIDYHVHSKFKNVKTQNVLGLLPGKFKSDSTILVTAHYDHHGGFSEDVYFPGANDNASGVALMLSLAQYFKENPLKHAILFTAFSGEEVGLEGSKYFAKHLPVKQEAIKFFINLDMVASGESGIVAMGGENLPKHFDKLAAINDSLGIGELGKRKHTAISDHFPLYEQGLNGFYLYTKDGKQPYHHIDDRPETLEWDDFWNTYELTRNFLMQL